MFIKNIILIIGLITFNPILISSKNTSVSIIIKDINSSVNNLKLWQEVIAISKILHKQYKDKISTKDFHDFVNKNMISGIKDDEIIKRFPSINQQEIDDLKKKIPTIQKKEDFDQLYEVYHKKFFKTQEDLLKELMTYKYKEKSLEKDMKFLNKQLNAIEDNYFMWDVYLKPIHGPLESSSVTYNNPAELEVYKFLPFLIETLRHFIAMIKNMDNLDQYDKKIKNIEKTIKTNGSIDESTRITYLKEYVQHIQAQKDISVKMLHDIQGSSALNLTNMETFVKDHLLDTQTSKSEFSGLIDEYKLIGQKYQNYGTLYSHSGPLLDLIDKKFTVNMDDVDIIKEQLPWVDLQQEYGNYSNDMQVVMDNLGIKTLIEQGVNTISAKQNNDKDDNDPLDQNKLNQDKDQHHTQFQKDNQGKIILDHQSKNNLTKPQNNHKQPSTTMMIAGTFVFVGGGTIIIITITKVIKRKKEEVVLNVG